VHEEVREMVRAVAHRFNDLLPECPTQDRGHRSPASAMWAANSAVACYGDDPEWNPPAPPGGSA
jgi:hypothetical protein